MARQTTPRQILRHPFLSCMLSFASWMLRPFLFNVSFTPFIQLFLGLPILLTPVTSESYTFNQPLISHFFNMSKPPKYTLIHSLTYTYIFVTHSSNIYIRNPINPLKTTDIPQTIHFNCFNSSSILHL